MPRDSDKNNNSRGRRDRPGDGKSRAGAARAVARAARGRRGGRRRNSPSAGLPARVTATASGVPMPGNPTARNRLARSLMRVRASPTPASAMAMIVRRAGDFGDAPRPRGDRRSRAFQPRRSPRRGDRPDRGPRKDFRPRDAGGGEKRPFKPRGDRPNFNRDDRPPRRDRDDARAGWTFFRQEIWRQEALYPARRWRREAALYAAWRRFSQRRRPSAWRSAL